jgi:hypothetical protein
MVGIRPLRRLESSEAAPRTGAVVPFGVDKNEHAR